MERSKKALEFSRTPLYRKALLAIKGGFPHKLDSKFSEVGILPRIRQAKASIKDLGELLSGEFAVVVAYSIIKMEALDGEETEEIYPPGYDPDPDELPVVVEDLGYDPSYLILNLLEILSANRGGKVLEEYLKACRIPKAPQYAKQVRGFLGRARKKAKPERLKVVFKLKQRGGYPPVGYESIWAETLDVTKGLYRVDNIPFFAYGVSLGDTVHAKRVEGELRFRKVVEKSGNSTLRVFCRDASKIPALQKLLIARGGRVERSHLKKLFAVNVPKGKRLSAFLGYLEQNANKHACEVEDADVNHAK